MAPEVRLCVLRNAEFVVILTIVEQNQRYYGKIDFTFFKKKTAHKMCQYWWLISQRIAVVFGLQIKSWLHLNTT